MLVIGFSLLHSVNVFGGVTLDKSACTTDHDLLVGLYFCGTNA